MLFWFTDFKRTFNQAYCNWLDFAHVIKIFEDHKWFSSIVVLCLMVFDRVIQSASRDQLGLFHWLNDSWIINDLRMDFDKLLSSLFQVIKIKIIFCYTLRVSILYHQQNIYYHSTCYLVGHSRWLVQLKIHLNWIKFG